MTIKSFSQEQHANLFAKFFPDGKAYEAKFRPASNLRKTIESLSKEQKRMYDSLSYFLEQRDPRDTDIFLDEWESALSIPDDCFPLADNKQDRRDYIFIKLTSLSVQTEADYENLAALFGFTISFPTGNYPPYSVPFIPETVDLDNFPPYPVPFIPISFNQFNWVIEGDFDSNPDKAVIFQCLVRKLVPVTYSVIFITT